jgi:hypothetical protein
VPILYSVDMVQRGVKIRPQVILFAAYGDGFDDLIKVQIGEERGAFGDLLGSFAEDAVESGGRRSRPERLWA